MIISKTYRRGFPRRLVILEIHVDVATKSILVFWEGIGNWLVPRTYEAPNPSLLSHPAVPYNASTQEPTRSPTVAASSRTALQLIAYYLLVTFYR